MGSVQKWVPRAMRSTWRGLADGRVQCMKCGATHKPCMGDTTRIVEVTMASPVDDEHPLDLTLIDDWPQFDFANCMRPDGHTERHSIRCDCGNPGLVTENQWPEGWG